MRRAISAPTGVKGWALSQRSSDISGSQNRRRFRPDPTAPRSIENVLQFAGAHDNRPVDGNGGSHDRNIEVSSGVAAGEFVSAGREQKIAGDRAQLGAIGVA